MTSKNMEIGRSLGEVRLLHGETLEQLAKRLGVSKSYLSKIENGHKPVPASLLKKYSGLYGNSASFSAKIKGQKLNIQNNEGERNKTMEKTAQNPTNQQLQINVNPEKTPVLYSDFHQVSTNDGGVTLSFAQSAQPMPVMQVVSRIGLSHTQAKELYKTLGGNLKHYFSSKDLEF